MGGALRPTLLLVLLCVAPAAAGEPVRSLYEMRTAGVVMQKWDNSCGAAALATLLTYYKNYPVSEPEVARGMLRQTEALKVKVRGGFSLLDMKRYLAEIGKPADGYEEVTLDDLPQYVPAIVPTQVRGYDHFVVVKSLDDKRVYLADPGFGNYDVSRDWFKEIWSGIVFVVDQPEGTS